MKKENLKNKKSRKIKKTIAIIIAVIFLAVGIFALRSWGAFNNFLDKITNHGPESRQYSVLVIDDSDINELEQLENKSIGFLAADLKSKDAEQFLQTKISFAAGFYDSTDALIDGLNNNIFTAIALESDRVAAFNENDQNPLEKTKVIYTFEIEVVSESKVSNKKVTTEPFAVYISGSDSRHGVKATARSDVNIIAVINPEQAKILLVSIPRDMYVQLHGTQGLKDKLTHAGIYGIDMSKATIEDFLNTKIDYTVKVSFDTVIKVVDQLDGIEINSDTAMKLKAEGKDKICEFVVGTQKVDGDCALRFARERKSYKTGDRHRGENQQQVIASIIAKISDSKNYLLKLPSILDIAADSFETSFNRDDVTALIRMQLESSKKWQTESISLDGTGDMQPTYSMGANLPLYVMIPSAESLEKAQAKISEYLTASELVDIEADNQ